MSNFNDPAPPPDAPANPVDTTLVANPTAQTDTTTVRMVVTALAATVLGALGAVTWLISTGQDAAQIAPVATMGTTGLGALAAVLVSTRSRG